MADPRIKTIKIKTGVVKRLTKEKVMYEKEAQQQKDRVEKFKNEGKDEYEVRKQEEVLQECLMMVPDCQRRLLAAYEDLNGILNSELDLQESGDYITSKAVLEEAKLQLPQTG